MGGAAGIDKNSANERSLFLGRQWGEPIEGENCLRVKRDGEVLEIIATLPRYLSGDHPCDLVRQYEIALKNYTIGKQRLGKESPHIRFANADNDEKLIDFVRDFGPVTAYRWEWLRMPQRSRRVDDPVQQTGMRAWLDLDELRNEQRIFKAALGLVLESTKKDTEYNFVSAKCMMAEIAKGIRKWPLQWGREKKALGHAPLWKVRQDSQRRIGVIAKAGRDRLLPPQLDARIVLCELINVFPMRVFPNTAEMLAYIRFGIRPLLYSVLRREFLQGREIGVCANTQCRSFFEVERAGQQFCDDVCSRQQRQRIYWKKQGKERRKIRNSR